MNPAAPIQRESSRRGRLAVRRPFVALGLLLALGLAVPGRHGLAPTWAQATPEASAGKADDEVIRLYDVIYMTRDRRIEGTILTRGDLETLTEVEVKMKPRGSSGSAVVTLRREDIVRVVRRQSGAEVYRLKAARVEAEHDPVRRAPAEAELADWCRTRLAILDGEAPHPDAALRHYVAAVQLDPSIHRVYPRILDILSSRGPLETADEERLEMELLVLELAARGGYENPELDYRMGLIEAVRLNEPDQALPHLEKVLRSDYGNRGHLRRARSIVARRYQDRGDFDKARAVYERIVTEPETDPSNFEAYFELGRLGLAEDTPESRGAARESFEKALVLQPEYWPLLGFLAALDFTGGDNAAATRKLETYLEHEPDAFEAAADLALVQALGGKPSASEKRLRELLLSEGSAVKARAHLLLGKILDDRGELPGAVSEYRRALDVNRDSPVAGLHLGSALLRTGEPEEARQVLGSLLASRGDHRPVFVACSRLLADAELALGRDREARIHLQRAFGLDPSDVPLRERLGILLMRQGKHDEAFDHLEAVRTADETRPATLAALGYYHYGRQEFSEARERFDAVLRLTHGPSRSAHDPHLEELNAYAARGRDLIDELRELEVWSADFSGEDAPRVDGWEEVERFGIEISRRDGAMLFSGTQRGDPQGVTMAQLERSVDSRTFERVLLRARVQSGSVRLGLMLEGESQRGASTGIVLRRDLDGLMGIMVEGTRSGWEALEPGKDEASAGRSGRSAELFLPGNVRWPDDDADHTLEIRRAHGRAASESTRANARGETFDLFIDGRPVARNVAVPTMSGRAYRIGVTAQTDREGSSYSVSVKELNLYRRSPGK